MIKRGTCEHLMIKFIFLLKSRFTLWLFVWVLKLMIVEFHISHSIWLLPGMSCIVSSDSTRRQEFLMPVTNEEGEWCTSSSTGSHCIVSTSHAALVSWHSVTWCACEIPANGCARWCTGSTPLWDVRYQLWSVISMRQWRQLSCVQPSSSLASSAWLLQRNCLQVIHSSLWQEMWGVWCCLRCLCSTSLIWSWGTEEWTRSELTRQGSYI